MKISGEEQELKMLILIKKFLEYLTNQKRYSKHTVDAYGRELYFFEVFLRKYKAEIPTKKTLAELNLTDFRAYFSERKKNKISNATIARNISSIKSFFTFLKKNKEIQNHNIENLEHPKIPKKLPKAIDEKDIKKMILELEKMQKPTWIIDRNRAIIFLCWGVGLRISEALSLTKKMLQNDSILIQGKGKKDRIIPFLPIVKEVCKKAINSCPFPILEDKIFRGIRGGKMNPREAQRLLQYLRQAVGLPVHTTPHSLRHSFATHLLIKGTNLRILQKMLGHSSLSTTQNYTKITNVHLKNVYKKFHPKGKK
ncbi:MAG: tyrosine-type recombinase/integrase [Alphaproteobacteria bacterium]|nr:MAG: hypothetical protein B6I23_01535 [Rickettsiaceae bacterium 4572_127]